ncbi:MAG: hypothetical protein M3167_08825 [Acidobacteriota bacterium]|nr:hypothetical protein [Acidobacteriota bacterium]
MNRPRASGSTVLRILLAVGVEAFLYLNYFAHEARFHWFTHFYVGGSVALILVAVVARRLRRPVPFPLVWVILGHLVAMFPDFLFEAGIAHRRWMDVFLGHLSTHFIPGRNWTWYAVFVLSLGAYLWNTRASKLVARAS